MFKKALIYLGLGPDDEYEIDDDVAGSPLGPAPAPAVARTERSVEPRPAAPTSATVRPIIPGAEPSAVRTLPSSAQEPAIATPTPPSRVVPSSGSSAIRIVEAATTTKPFAVSPDSFNDAQEIGDRFKTGQPVIVNLQGVDKDLRRRLVDFASGLCYALAGKMDRVADQVYLLTPADVEVSHDDTRRALD
jgi:cell division inhibitor SepF